MLMWMQNQQQAYALAHAEDVFTLELLSQVIRAQWPDCTPDDVRLVLTVMFMPQDEIAIPWELL